MLPRVSSTFPRPLPGSQTIESLLRLGREPAKLVSGDAQARVATVASLVEADETSVAFVRGKGPAAQRAAAGCRAALLLAEVEVEAPGARALALVPDARRFLGTILTALYPPLVPDPAVVRHPDARIDPTAVLGPYAVVEADVVVGPGCVLGPHSVLHGGARLGAGCRVGAGSVIGRADEGGYRDGDGFYRLPALGSAILEDGVVVGSHAIVMRGVLQDTRIGRDARIGNLVNVGVNCRVGARTEVYVGSLLCGSAVLGDDVVVGAGASVNNGVRVGDGCRVGQGAVVTRHVPNDRFVVGHPARPR